MRRRQIVAVVVVFCFSCAGPNANGSVPHNDTLSATGTGGADATVGPVDSGSGSSPTQGPASGPSGTDATSGGTNPIDEATAGSGGESTGAPPTEPGPVVVYVTDGNASLQVWSADATSGVLQMEASYETGRIASQLALHPDRLHLYATTRGGGNDRVLAYEINPTDGTLTELGATSIELDPVYWSIHPTGDFAYSASFGGDEIGTWAIASDFTVREVAIQVLSAGEEPHAIVPHPGGQWLYVPHRGGNKMGPHEIRQYEVDPTSGTLEEVDTVAAAPGSGPRHLAFDTDGRHAYLANEFGDSVSHFTVDGETGALTLTQTLPTIPGKFAPGSNTCADIHVSPDDATVYVSNRGHDSLAMFSIGPGGALTSLGQIPTEATPREFDVDPTGRFVYSAGLDSGSLASYTIDTGGTLTATGTVRIGGNPLWVLSVELPIEGR